MGCECECVRPSQDEASKVVRKKKKSLYDRDVKLYKEKFGDDEYGLSCLESAKKVMQAFDKEMNNAGHSGFSASLTSNLILDYLKGIPYFPLEDSDFVSTGENLTPEEDIVELIQCPICTSVFKSIYKDGTIKYSDVNRVVFYDKDHTGKYTTWHNGLASQLVNERFPITMPYKPNATPFKVYGFTRYFDEQGVDVSAQNVGSYNRVYFEYFTTPTGEKVDLHLVMIEGYKEGMLIPYGDALKDNEFDKNSAA